MKLFGHGTLQKPPGRDTIEAYLRKLKPTAPGKDGVPNRAWQKGGTFCVEYLTALLDAHLCGIERPLDINEGAFHFIPKSANNTSESAAAEVVYRHPSELRPLTLKNGDNKIIAGCASWCISTVISKSACKLQNGFIHGRQLVQNTVDLDFSSREHCLSFNASNDLRYRCNLSLARKGIVGLLPILVLFDFAAAFPSVSHNWLRAVLKALQVPRGIMNLLECLYNGSEAFCNVGGSGMAWIFSVLSGVLQGCPFSGSLFVIAIDPLLFQFHKYLCAPALATVRACAGDIGAALKCCKDLAILWRIFEAFRKASLLTLKPQKCILIPLAVECSESNCSAFRAWLTEHLPEWAHFSVLPAAKYLGIYLGPLAGSEQWKAPLAKFQDRISHICAQKNPSALAVTKFISKCISVLGYVAQVVPPPRNFKSVELAAALKVLSMATCSLTTEAVYDLSHWGWNNITRPVLYMRACMIRAACKTLVDYERMHSELRRLAFEGLPVKRAVNNELIPEGWDSPALCTNLVHTLDGQFGDLPAVKIPEFRSLVRKFKGEGIKSKGCQTQIYKFLRSCISNPWPELLAIKAAILSPSSLPWHIPDNFQSSLLKISKHVGKSTLLCLLKTWANSWSTTYRYHEAVLWPCIWGCEDEKDELTHYLRCNHFWSGILAVTRNDPALIQVDPLCKLCLVNPSSLWASLIAVGFQCYHACKIGHRDEIQAAINSGNFHKNLALLSELAEHFWSEVRVGSRQTVPNGTQSAPAGSQSAPRSASLGTQSVPNGAHNALSELEPATPTGVANTPCFATPPRATLDVPNGSQSVPIGPPNGTQSVPIGAESELASSP